MQKDNSSEPILLKYVKPQTEVFAIPLVKQCLSRGEKSASFFRIAQLFWTTENRNVLS